MTTAPATRPGKSLVHAWVVLANIPVNRKEAEHATLRKSIRLTDGRKTKALEVICERCRRNFEDVADAQCQAGQDNTYLIGGTPGVRAKRKRALPERIDGVVVPAPRQRTAG